VKLFSISIGLLLAAIAVFFVPVSFAVDGFGLVVDPGGVRTVRAAAPGVVLHFPADGDGRFHPGQIVSAVTDPEAAAGNAALRSTLRRDFAKVETDYLDKASKLRTDRDRDLAKHDATAEQLAARQELVANGRDMLAELKAFTAQSEADIEALNEERLAQLSRLEELLGQSGEASAMPAQTLASMLEDLQADRLSVISSQGTRFSSEKAILDLNKELNTLTFSNSVDEAELDILTDKVADSDAQLAELRALRDAQRAEAEARYLSKLQVPQVAIAAGRAVDMRMMQATRADVSRGDAVRLLAEREPVHGLSLILYGAPVAGEVELGQGEDTVTFALPATAASIRAALTEGGWPAGDVFTDTRTVGSTEVTSIFISWPDTGLSLHLRGAQARDAADDPVLIVADMADPDDTGPDTATPDDEIVGFLENRHAIVLREGQAVRGSVSDARTGARIVFDGTLLKRDFSTVDTNELGIRLGNQSLASKLLRLGVLSQVVVGIAPADAKAIADLPGAVVQLTFPLARQSLFSFLLNRDASI